MNLVMNNSSLPCQRPAATALAACAPQDNAALQESKSSTEENPLEVSSPSKLEVISWLRRFFRHEAGETPEFGLLSIDE